MRHFQEGEELDILAKESSVVTWSLSEEGK